MGGLGSKVGDLIEFVDILHTTVSDKTKRILAQIGSVTGRTVDGGTAEWMQHVGIASRPSKPVAGKAAARGIIVRQGGIDTLIATEDDRGIELKGNLDHGETCIYGAGEDGNAQGRILIKKDGSINIYTRQGNTKTGKGMVIQIDAMNDAIRITNSKGYGLIIDPDGARLTTGGSGGVLNIGADGSTTLNGTGPCTIDGTSVAVGIPPTKVLVPGLNSAIIGPAGIAGAPSSKVLIST